MTKLQFLLSVRSMLQKKPVATAVEAPQSTLSAVKENDYTSWSTFQDSWANNMDTAED